MTDASGQIAFVQATWHRNIVDRAKDGFTEQMRALGHPDAGLEFFEVAGAFEIPLTALRLARTGRYDAIVAAALVVDGGIYRHEFVATAVIDGLMRVQLDTDTPVFSVVLTPQQFHEHEEHLEAARACAVTLKRYRSHPFA